MRLRSAFCLALAFACGGKSGPPASTHITGTLVSGAETPRRTGLTALAGYKLDCLTFAQPPAAGTGTSDSAGNVSLQLTTNGAPWGCFIQDASGNQVAAVIFKSGSTK